MRYMQGKKESNINWTSIIVGTFFSLMVSALLAAGLAAAQINNWIEAKSVGITVTGIQVISGFVGAIYAKDKAVGRTVLHSLLTGVGYCACLVIVTAVFFGGQYQEMFVPCLLVLGIATAAGLIRKRRRGRLKNSRVSNVFP